ncbi:MAG: hypothetical protein JW828_07660 [Sedimentisphaerales bacterium]|nr:hypothetical protein [Sedimentisphaerales bacterium]
MTKKLYVGNLSDSVDETMLRTVFSAHGTISGVKIITDRDSNISKGYGFVELSSESEAAKAAEALNGMEVQGQAIVVAPAKPQRSHSPARGRQGGSGGGYGGRSGPGGGGRPGGQRRRF